MPTEPVRWMSVDEYLAGERDAEVRHEYVAGEIHAMAGANERHNTIALNIASRLRERARGGPCRVFMADMKLHVSAADAFYYPDVFVTCDPHDGGEYFKERPCAVVEVLSAATAAIDRREKRLAYRTLPTLREYVIVDQLRWRVFVHRRAGDGWESAILAGGTDRVPFSCLDTALTLGEIYEDVVFPEVLEAEEVYTV